jgi:hypothetical protein
MDIRHILMQVLRVVMVRLDAVFAGSKSPAHNDEVDMVRLTPTTRTFPILTSRPAKPVMKTPSCPSPSSAQNAHGVQSPPLKVLGHGSSSCPLTKSTFNSIPAEALLTRPSINTTAVKKVNLLHIILLLQN